MRRHLVVEQKPYSPTICFKFTSWRTNHFKQVASRLGVESMSWKRCNPGCGRRSRQNHVLHDHDDNNNMNSVNPTSSEMHSEMNSEMHSISFSLNSCQLNELRQTLDDLIADSEKQTFGLGQESPSARKLWHDNVTRDSSFETRAAYDDSGEFKAGHGPYHGGSGRKVVHDSSTTEWIAEVGPGVYITFCTGLDGFNDLKRINFSQAVFNNKQLAQKWWSENCMKVQSLYNVRPPSSTNSTNSTSTTTTTMDDDSFQESFSSAYVTSMCSPSSEGDYSQDFSRDFSRDFSGDYSLTRRKSSADARLKEDFPSNDTFVSACHSWIQQAESGVYLTIVTVPGVGRQLRRVRFRREKFSEGEAAVWWELNRQRIYAQYITRNTS
ncbi:unnamed protein product [Calypogeia fissa]